MVLMVVGGIVNLAIVMVVVGVVSTAIVMVVVGVVSTAIVMVVVIIIAMKRVKRHDANRAIHGFTNHRF